MSIHFSDLAAQAAADGAISAEDILALRQASWANGTISIEEADALFRINDSIGGHTPEWSDCFVEAVGEFIVNGTEPKGYVDEAQADWLIGRIDHNGKLESMTELELLVRVFERALGVPDHLRAYALAQIEQAVLTGEGPTRKGGALEKGNVTQGEAQLMRRIVFASGSDRPAGVSRAEAEMLFRIKDAALDADNAPEWQRLFVQGVGNYLMGFSGKGPLGAERVAELEAFVRDARPSVVGFVQRMARAELGEGMRAVFDRKRAQGPSIAQQVSNAEAVTGDERLWLDTRINANDMVDGYDQALLDFLAEEEPR
jgi:hypothetical protein